MTATGTPAHRQQLVATIDGAPLQDPAGAVSPSVHGAVLKAAFALLTPEQLAEVVAHRVIIEQAKGMLMMVYGIDAASAFDVLRRKSQSANVKLRVLAERLCEELLDLAQDGPGDLRFLCDAAVLTGHERVGAVNGAPGRPQAASTYQMCILTPKSVVGQWVR